ncbi:hypothetical protein DV735_g2996, partial [Chaetothyriales sp. CBS 134920]
MCDCRLSIVNPQRKVLPGPRLLHELVPADAGDQTAIDFLHLDGERTEISYAAFHRLSHCLARQIRSCLPPQSKESAPCPQIIPVVVPQCPELYLAWRAVLIAGAAFCPVSPDTPLERLRFILGDVSASLVLCLADNIARINAANPELPCLAVSLQALRSEIHLAPPPTEPFPPINPQAPAYVQYTSGSSGLPKGVLVSHLAVTQSLLAHDEHIPRFRRFLQFASPTFDVSIFEVFFPFFRASTLVGCSRDRMLSDLPGAINSLRADAAELTPTVAGTLLRSRAAAPGLKTLLTIGEMLTGPVVAEFGGSADRDSMLYAMYGPTEAAIHCTLAPKLAADATVRSIGLPLSTVTALVLLEGDDSSQNFSIAPRGQSGELVVAGQLADGYINRPEKNAEAFIQLPGYGRVYRTGDRAICHPDGRLSILGRISEGQVKLRGQRIELGEIEEVASKTRGCSLAIASVIDDSLILFCVTDPGLSSKPILDTCKAWLPTYMRPTQIIMLPDDIPRLPSGKVDRRRLKTLYQERTIHAVSQPGFNNETEQIIAQAFQAVLHTTIYPTTNLWSTGLDSLRAIKIAASLRDNFPHCTLTMLLEAETVMDVSNALDHASGLATPSSFLSENVDGVETWRDIEARVQTSLEMKQIPLPSKILPCSSMQVAMLTETASISHLNFNTIRVKRGPGVSHSHLWQAVCLLAESNDILRSGFFYAGEPHVPFVRLVWEKLETASLSLLHPLMVEIDVNEPSISIIHIHHAMYDGWSWELILDDLNIIMEGGQPPLRPSFLDFVHYQDQRQTAQLHDSDSDSDYWSHLGLGSGSPSMPSLAASASKSTRVPLVHDLDVSYTSLSKLAEEVRVSRQAILQSCWALLLATYTDASEVTFGDVVSGRHVPLASIDQIIGPCLSTYPIKVELESHKTFRDLVVSAQRQYLERLRHTETTLHDILRRSTPSNDQPIFDTLFVWQQGEVRPPNRRNHISTLSSYDALNYMAVIEVEPLGDIVQARLTVQTSHIPPSHAELLLVQLDHLLSFVVSHLDSPLRDNTLWQDLNINALSVSNVEPQFFDHRFDLYSTIETLAENDPERPAIRFVTNFDPASGYIESETVTYGQLHQRATAFACHLAQKWNAKADDLICIISGKSINLYIAILATVMTGAGYMCIDPSTPTSRVSQILDQAHCAVIITDSSIEIDFESPVVHLYESIESSSDNQDFHITASRGNELAYCVWTSGTTGKPKGVLVTRQNLLSNLDFLSSIYPCEPRKDALLQACSPAFDVSVFEIFWTWHMGMALCAAPNDILFRDIEKLIDSLDITFLSMTPSVAALVNPEKVPKVKTLVTAGEPMNSRVFERWAGRGLFMGYGPSETTNICNIRPWVQISDPFNNVGPAFPNTSLFVCGRAQRHEKMLPLSLQDFHILPKGAVGEIWIGGDQVARGYVDHELTIRSFFDHPQFGRLYRSGDIGRLLADETLVVLGREDDQVKLSNTSIEITKETTIFELGLDSINAVQIAVKLRDLGYHISSSSILEGPTLAEIAESCSSKTASGVKEQQLDIRKFDNTQRPMICDKLGLSTSDVEMVRPCTPTQCGILSEHLKSQGSTYYNTMHLQLIAGVDKDKLLTAWQAVMDRHDMLRTGFAGTDSSKYPFVMITYRPEVFTVRTSQGKPSISDVDELLEPPWHLSFRGPDNAPILGVSMLHALYDAQSLDIFLADVSSVYNGNQLPLPTSISHVISSILSRGQWHEAKQFWQEDRNLIQPTRFPDLNISNEKNRTQSISSRPSKHRLSDVKNRCAALGCSLQSVFQYTWARILASYTSQDRVTFGLTLSGRNFGDERDEAAFPCINTLPFTVEIGNDRNSTLSQISKLNAGLNKSQHVPLISIRRWQDIEGDSFDTLFVFQKYKHRQSADVPWRPVEDEASAEYAVSLEVLPDEDTNLIKWQITYSEQVIPPGAAQILLGQLDFVLGEVVEAESGPRPHADPTLSILPINDPLIQTNVRFLHEFVEKSAAVQESAPALEFVNSITGGVVQKSTWTYVELEQMGNRVANLLASHGVSPGDYVAVHFDKCPEASFAILGVLKAGAVYVAIDPGAPADRKAFVLRDAGCRIVLTTADKLSTFQSITGIDTIALDDDVLLKRQSPSAPRLIRPLSPEDTCYCLYTSGSTGTPKGCLISHQSAVQAMMFFQRVFTGHWTASSRWLQFASFHFDVSVLEQYFSWGVGICVTSGPRDLLLEDLPGFINATGITHLDLTPTLARLLTPEEVPSISQGVFIVGGEQVSQDIIDTWGDAACLYNFYGPSEVTIGCTVHPRVKKGVKSTNIGQQWDNVGSFVLKPGSEKPVLRGAVGELCLSGALVGKGYLNRPDLTKDKFVVLENFGTRIYRTGDLVRLLHDDSFEFVGRIDDQVKLRGQRLEIGEINQTIREGAAEVKAVATLAVKHHNHGREQLVAFISTNSPRRAIGKPVFVFNDQATALVAQLRDFCAKKLPGYMIPTSFMIVSDMPLSANNKIDNKVLRALYESSNLNSTEGLAAEDEIPSQQTHVFDMLCQTLQAFLSLPEGTVKPSSRLFELGIDSVSAIGLVRKLKMAGFSHVDVSTVLRNSKASQLVLALSSHRNVSATLAQDVDLATVRIRAFATKQKAHIRRALDLQDDGIESIAPCTPLQEGMISVVTAHDGGEQTYFLRLPLELHQGIDPARLRKAWLQVQSACSILRTFFVSTPDGFAQIVLQDDSGICHPFDETGSQWNEDSFSRWIQQATNFGSVLPWRVKFDEAYMTLFIFHGLYDGISLPMLLDKVAAAYNGETIQRSIFYDVLPYGPLLQRSDAKAFWKEKLKDTISLGITRKGKGQREVHASPLVVKESLTLSSVTKFCTSALVTEPAVFHAAWLLALHEIYGVHATLGLVLSGRAIAFEGAERVIGPTLNTVPCCIEVLQPGAQFVDLAKACHKFVVDVLPYQHTALRDIAKWIDHDPRTRMFDCLFVFQKQRKDDSEQNIWRDRPGDSTPDYPLNLEVEQKLDGTFILSIVSRQDYLDYSVTEALFSKLKEVLERFNNVDTILLPKAFHEQHIHHNVDDVDTFGETVDHSENVEWTPLAEAVRDMVAELAGKHASAVSLNSPSIFELGLDSIDAMKLATRLRARNFKIRISEIMRAGTVAQIAAAISQTTEPVGHHMPNGHDKYFNGDVAEDQDQDIYGEQILPVTPMQEGLLLDFQKYYNVFVFELGPATDVQRIKTAWAQLTIAWPVLRAKFEVVERSNGSFGYRQVISDLHGGLQVEEVSEAESSLDAFVHEIKNLPDELDGLPALRVVIVHTKWTRYMLTAMPHASYDAWSLQLLHQELRRLYQNPRSDSSLSAARVRLCQNHLKIIAQQAESVNAEHFWRRSLANLRPTIVHRLSHDTSICEPQVLQRQSTMPLSQVQGFCKVQGITIQSLGLACWSLLLAHYAQSLMICFGLILSGRTAEGSEELVLPTFNTVIFPSNIQASESRAAFVKRTHHSAMDVSEFQHFPLRKALKMAKMSGRAPSDLFNTLFTYQKGPGLAGGDAEDLYHEVDLEGYTPDAPYAVNIEMENKGQDIRWTVATQLGIASRHDAELLLENLDDVLKALVQHPEQDVVSISVADGTSIRGLLAVNLSSISNNSDTKPQTRPMEVDDDSWSKNEAIIRDVLAEVSRVDGRSLSKTAVFYELGLDSVSAIKITSLLKKKGIKLPVSKILQAQTIERMGQAIEEPGQAENHINGTAILQNSRERRREERLQQYGSLVSDANLSAADIEDILPTTAGQMYMLHTWKKSGGRVFYPTFWLEVSQTIESKVHEAMKNLQSRITMLRTIFVASGPGSSSILQVIINASVAARFSFPWTYTFTRKDQKLYLGWKLHHALYDAVSLHLMVTELTRLCRGSLDMPILALNQDLASFSQVTVSLDETAKARQRAFWTSYLDDCHGAGSQLVRGSFSTPRAEKYIPDALATASVAKLARQEGITLQSLFFAACGRAYSELGNKQPGPSPRKDNVVLGLYLANRSLNIPDLPALVGPTLNIVPLKINVCKPLVEAARDVQQDITLISQAEHCGVSLREVYEWTAAGVTVDCVVNFLRLPEEEEEGDKADSLPGIRPVADMPGLQLEGASPSSSASPLHTRESSGIVAEEEQQMEWVLPSVDIEAKVGEDGVLSVGVFSPADMLDQQGVDGLIGTLVRLLVERVEES